MRGVRLDWCRPFEIWQVANKGQQPFIGDIQRSEPRGLSLLLLLVSGPLSILALSLAGLKRLFPFQLVVSDWLACDHDC